MLYCIGIYSFFCGVWRQINRRLVEKANQVSDMDKTIRQVIRKLQARDADLGLCNAELRRVQAELKVRFRAGNRTELELCGLGSSRFLVTLEKLVFWTTVIHRRTVEVHYKYNTIQWQYEKQKNNTTYTLASSHHSGAVTNLKVEEAHGRRKAP